MFATTHARDGRDNNFHLIRLSAAIAVIFTHSFSIVTGEFESQPLVRAMNHSIGNYAVDVFFVLSGFLVTQSLARDGDLLRFAVSRILRIFPALTIAVLGTTFVLGPLVSEVPLAEYFVDRRVPIYIAGTISTLSSENPLPGVFETLPEAGRVNVSLWTLKYELAAYVSLFLIAVLSLRTGLRSFLACSFGLLLLYALGRVMMPWPGETPPPLSNVVHFLLSFYFGVAAYVLRVHIPLSLAGVAALAVCAFLAQNTPVREFFEMLAVGYGALWLAFGPNVAQGWINKSGDYSFGLYIFAFPVQQTIRLAFPDIGILELFALGTLLTFPLAVISWHVVERPCLGWRAPLIASIQNRIGPRILSSAYRRSG